MRPSVPSARRSWPLRRLAGKAPSCRPTGSIDCRFEVRDFAPGRAGADPAPRGAGPEAGDGSAAQPCSSVHPAETEAGFGGVLCFKKGVALLDLRLPGYEGSFAGARTPMTFLPS